MASLASSGSGGVRSGGAAGSSVSSRGHSQVRIWCTAESTFSTPTVDQPFALCCATRDECNRGVVGTSPNIIAHLLSLPFACCALVENAPRFVFPTHRKTLTGTWGAVAVTTTLTPVLCVLLSSIYCYRLPYTNDL